MYLSPKTKQLQMTKGKPIKDSKTTMTELVMPNDTNPLGNLMGGNLLRWMDVGAGICAAKHCESLVVTVSVDLVSFDQPILLGEVVTLEISATRAFNTSIEINVQVYASNFAGGGTRKCNSAYFTFVALNEDRTPRQIPKVMPITDEEVRLYDGALRRRQVRLIQAGKLAPKDATEIRDFINQ